MENRLKEIALGGALSLSLSFGHELGLFDALAAAGNEGHPASAKDVADKAGIDIEFVTVWLNGMVSGKMIECNADGNGYWINAANLKLLSGDEPAAGLVFSRMLPIYSSHYKQSVEMAKGKTLENRVKNQEGSHGHGHHEHQHGHEHQEAGHHQHGHGDGHHEHNQQSHGHGGGHGHGHDHHSEAFPLMELLSKTMFKKHLIPEFLPLTGVQEKLEAGGMEVLDVGCGTGNHLCEFAKHFPKCSFTGIDISPKAILRAQEVAKEMNVPNVKFEAVSGEEMPQEWTKRFSWVMSFNSIHDHKHPDKAMKEINRVLHDDGRYTMVEINKPENNHNRLKSSIANIFDIAGLFIVLPVRGATEVYKWTNVGAMKMLKDAGFAKVEVVDTPFFDFDILYLCEKQ